MKSWDKDILDREQLVKDPEVKKGFRCWRKQKKTNVVNNCPHVCRGSRPSPKGDLAYWNVLKLILGSWISALIIMLNLPEETAFLFCWVTSTDLGFGDNHFCLSPQEGQKAMKTIS